jgi:hypothetical protein
MSVAQKLYIRGLRLRPKFVRIMLLPSMRFQLRLLATVEYI